MKKLTILFLSVLLFSCCPEKKKQQTTPTEIQETKFKVVDVDTSRFKTISIEKDSVIPDADIEWLFEGEFGPV